MALVFLPRTTRKPRVPPGATSDYLYVFSELGGWGSLEIQLGEEAITTPLYQVADSVLSALKGDLFSAFLCGEASSCERILSDHWRLVARRSGPDAIVSLRRLSSLVPKDSEIEEVRVSVGHLRGAMASFIKWALHEIDDANPWIHTLAGRDEVYAAVARFESLEIG